MTHLRLWRGLYIKDDDKTMIFQTWQQMKILASSFSAERWIRGPAGSGKTFLLITKAVTLAQGILSSTTGANEKMLVVCFNSILCKALERRIKSLLNVPKETDVSSFLHFKTFTELVMELAGLEDFPKSNREKEDGVNLALKTLKASKSAYMYDHILVDEGQDLYGKEWPELLQHMYRKPQNSKEGLPTKPGFFWIMYDVNQYLNFAREKARSHCESIRNSEELNKVLRNTDNVFKQSMKYFKSVMSNDSPVTLGHKVTGLPIKWDDSLASSSLEMRQGASLVGDWIKKLQKEKVDPKDICILVQNQEEKRLLRKEMADIGVKSQTGDDRVEGSLNFALVESIRRFKGLESKVVILYNPPFQRNSQLGTEELLYTAVTRCSCFLVVISTEEGCKVLKTDVGIKGEQKTDRQHPLTKQSFVGSSAIDTANHLQSQ